MSTAKDTAANVIIAIERLAHAIGKGLIARGVVSAPQREAIEAEVRAVLTDWLLGKISLLDDTVDRAEGR